jgi:ribosome-associated protein
VTAYSPEPDDPTPRHPYPVPSPPEEVSTIPEPSAPTATPIPAEVQLIVDALDDRRAKDITVLDLSTASETLDYFIVATGESSLQLKALEDAVRERLKAQEMLPKGVEGPSTRWVLLDYGYIVVHLMSPEARSFYDLEGLWADAGRLEVQPS